MAGKYTGKFQKGTEFVALHRVRPGDTLNKIAKHWGYDNPGPIIAYPHNLELIPFKIVDHQYNENQYRLSKWAPTSMELNPERTPAILVPAPSDWLGFYIVQSRELMDSYAKAAQQNVVKVIDDAKDVENWITLAEILSIFASFAAAFTKLGIKGSKIAAGKSVLDESLKKQLIVMAAEISTQPIPFMLPKPKGLKKEGFKFWAHTVTGWAWSASWWSGFWTGMIEGGDDGLDIWLHGTSAVSIKTSNEIMARLERDLLFLQDAIGTAGQQMQAPYYNHRVTDIQSQQPNTQQIYVTDKSDTLSKISKSYYGNSAHWKKIYEVNREKIGPNPNSLRNGLVLNIPYLR